MTSAEQEAQVLKSIVPKLEAEGYAVHVHPPRTLLPGFMQSYRPDAIALGSPKNLAIEVVLEGAAEEVHLASLRERFRDSKDWDLRVYYARSMDEKDELDVVPERAIVESLGAIGKLLELGQRQAALLMCWATFEAIGRSLFPRRFTRPQTPERLVEVLATDGYLLPTEADRLRYLAKIRNKLAHGELDLPIELADLETFNTVLQTLATRFRDLSREH